MLILLTALTCILFFSVAMQMTSPLRHAERVRSRRERRDWLEG